MIFFIHFSGCLLKEDDGLIEPRELMELMIYCRKATLSPENYPKDDGLGKFT